MLNETHNENTINTDDIPRLREIQLRLLNEFDTLCKKHEFRYWLDFGTLLGAVRNGKFIPWDDDIDVSMPMEDYKKFLKIADAELPKDIFVQTPRTDPAYKQYFTKLRDCYSTFIEHHESENTKYHQGIFIDIFPSVLYPKLPTLFRKVLTYTTINTRYAAFVNSEKVFLNYSIYYVCKFIWFLLSPLKGVAYGRTPEDNGYWEAIPLTYLYPLKEIEFEDKKYLAPNDVHGHLSEIYKDYMTLPPEKNRIPHAKLILLDTPCNHPRAMKRNKNNEK